MCSTIILPELSSLSQVLCWAQYFSSITVYIFFSNEKCINKLAYHSEHTVSFLWSVFEIRGAITRIDEGVLNRFSSVDYSSGEISAECQSQRKFTSSAETFPSEKRYTLFYPNSGLEFSLKWVGASRAPTFQNLGAQHKKWGPCNKCILSRIIIITLFNTIHMPQTPWLCRSLSSKY